MTAQEAIEDSLVGGVEDLVDGGALNAGQGKALLSKLTAARAKLDQGNTTAARNLLNAFINQANGLIDGDVLTPEVGQRLIGAATGIIEALDGYTGTVAHHLLATGEEGTRTTHVHGGS